MTRDEINQTLGNVRLLVALHPERLNDVLQAATSGVMAALDAANEKRAKADIGFLSALALRKYPRNATSTDAAIRQALLQIAAQAVSPAFCDLERELTEEAKQS